MYKKILENLHNLKKAEGHHSIKSPHFIFSAEAPRGTPKLKMNHEETMSFLNKKGYKTEEVQGMYGGPEKSIIVHNPHKEAVPHLFNLASNLGQESSIYSNGHKHEMHYHHGENAGKHMKGSGTKFHHSPPDDFYTTMGNTHFTHNFDTDTLHEPDKSMLANPMSKSEEEQDQPMTLHHYSNEPNLKTVDPSKQGSGFDSRTRGRSMEHKMSFFYPSHVSKEDISGTADRHVANARHKYTAQLDPEHKIYNASKDKDGFAQSVRTSNNNIFSMDHFVHHLKQAGYHGMIIDKHPTLKPVVSMFYPVKVGDRKLSKSESIYDQRYKVKDKIKNMAQQVAGRAAKSYNKYKRSISPKRRNSKHPLLDRMVRRDRRYK